MTPLTTLGSKAGAFCLSVAFFAGAPLAAQDADELAKKSNLELRREILRLLDEVEKGMGDVAEAVGKASLPAVKPDEVAAFVQKALEGMKSGEAREVPGWLKQYLDKNPDKLAEALGVNAEEAARLLKDPAALAEKLATFPPALEKLAEDQRFLKDVAERLTKTEEPLAELLDKQARRGQETHRSIEDALERAYELRRRETSGC